ncbi:MAG TPA: DNA alkylation repair protein [Candidatus Nitrosocosmicus sp.]|nr:DNA alkylation repair protein [Candidatus Nitrosocosmicus sp.]
MKAADIINHLKSLKNQKNIDGMARFGISSPNILGISIAVLRPYAKTIGKNHELAQELWESGIHEARLLAAFIEEPDKVAENQMEKWTADFHSWDICDQVCSNVFDKTPYAYKKAFEWAERNEEFVKRAGYVMMAVLAVHDKKAEDKKFIQFFPLLKKGSIDERNFVKKAVNWAIRQIGKRNGNLRSKAILLSEELLQTDSKSAKWIARDAIRELSLRH